MDPQWEEEGLFLSSVMRPTTSRWRAGSGEESDISEEPKQWNSSALMSHKTSSKHGFSIWERLHAESSALTVHERACSPRTRLPDTRKNKLAFNCQAPRGTKCSDQRCTEAPGPKRTILKRVHKSVMTPSTHYHLRHKLLNRAGCLLIGGNLFFGEYCQLSKDLVISLTSA